MTRVRVLIIFAILLSLRSIVPAQNLSTSDAASWSFPDQWRATQPLGSGGRIRGGQLSLAVGDCAPRPQALVQSRAADDTVIWERSARAVPERGALPLFVGLGEIDPLKVTMSTVHAVAQLPGNGQVDDGDILAVGDVFLSWLETDGKPRTAWGGFVVRLTPHGQPVAERYFGVHPTGPPLSLRAVTTTCTEVDCAARLAEGLTTVSLRELSVTAGGEIMVSGYENEAGERKPFLAVLSADLGQTLWSGTADEMPANLPTLRRQVNAAPLPKPISETDRKKQAPDKFTITAGLLDQGGLAELRASDNRYLLFFSEVQNQEVSLGEVVAEFDLTTEMPVVEQATVEVFVENCAVVTISLGGGFSGAEMTDLTSRQLCPFDEPVISIPVPASLADRLGFGPEFHSAAGELPALVGIRFDILREASVCAAGLHCASQGEAGGVDQVILTTEYP